jgi:hypothetical protein
MNVLRLVIITLPALSGEINDREHARSKQYKAVSEPFDDGENPIIGVPSLFLYHTYRQNFQPFLDIQEKTPPWLRWCHKKTGLQL